MAIKTAYSQDELQSIMTEVTAAVDEILTKSEGSAPNKEPAAAGGALPAETSTSAQSASDKSAQGGQTMKKDGEDPAAPPAESPAPEGSPSSGSESSSSSSGSSGGSSGDPMAAQGDPAAGASAGMPSKDQLVAAYSQLSPDELQLHMESLQQVLAQQQSAAAPPAAPAPAPAASASAPMASPSPSPSPAPGPSAVAPMPADQSQGVNPEFAMKTEAMSKEIEELKKNLGLATEALTLVLSQPKPKSIQGEDIIVKGEVFKPESLSKSEVTARLNRAVRSDTMTKTDREVVKSFYRGEKSVRDIAHLLK